MATFIGTNGDDIYNGGAASDSLDGAGGDDSLNGGGGNDTIQGGAGADTVLGGSGDDLLASYQFNTDGISSLDIYSNRDLIVGGAGYDRIQAGYGDSVDGGADSGSLTINFLGAKSGVHADFSKLYTDGSVTIGGGVITNISEVSDIQGSNFNDYLRPLSDLFNGAVHGNGGNDVVVGDYYATLLYGDDGDDTVDGSSCGYGATIHGGAGDDVLSSYLGEAFPETYGDDGNDTIDASYLADGGAGDDTIQLEFSYYQNLAYGGDGDDAITASYAYDELHGGAGADTIAGNDGSDQLFGGRGADRLDGGGDNDQLYADGEAADGKLDTGLEHDVLQGGDGNDSLSIGYGDDADGGKGADAITMVWDRAASGVILDTAGIISGAAFDFGGGTVQNVEKIAGLYLTDDSDVVTVAQQRGTVTVDGEGGDDRLSGTGSAVHLIGGDGDDTLVAAAGGDKLEGGDGDDTFILNRAGESVVETAGHGFDLVQSAITYTLGANLEALTLTGTNANGTGNELDNLIVGSDGKNGLSGLDGDDTIEGAGGKDKIAGGAGSDHLSGGLDNDVLKGGGDDDLMVGGQGADRMIGGTGADVFQFQSSGDFGGATADVADTITDFSQSQHDLIDLSGVDAVLGGADDGFAFIGTAAFSGTAGELRYERVGKEVLVTGDVDGDAQADFMIVLNGKIDLQAGDFVL